jgi:non-ribosomal peptide synthetase component F
MTLLAVFKALLYCYTGQDDLVVGTDIANRNQRETEGLIGFFVNQLVLRTDLSGNPTFWELLRRVRAVVLGAYDHQALPFDKLVEALNPQRDMSRTPLFQVKFVLQNAPTAALELSGLSLSPLAVDNRTAKFDLLLNMCDTKQGLDASLAYSTDLFNAATMARMLEHFEILVRSVVTQPDTRLNTLAEILDKVDKQYRVAKQGEFAESRHRMLKKVRLKPIHVPNRIESRGNGRSGTSGFHY